MIRQILRFFSCVFPTFLSLLLFSSVTIASNEHVGGSERRTGIASKTEIESLQSSVTRLLYDTDQWVSRFPPPLSTKLHHQLQKQIKQLDSLSLYGRVTKLLAWFSDQLQQSHEVRTKKGMLNGVPVNYLLVGYLAFYYVSEDGQSAGLWNTQTQAWQPLDKEDIRHLQTLWRMKKRYQPYGWVSLPMIASPKPYLPARGSVDKVESKNNSAIFSDKEQQRLFDQVTHIYKQLDHSPLALFFSEDLTSVTTSTLSVAKLQTLLMTLREQLNISASLSYVYFPRNNSFQEAPSRFLFLGPFSVIADDVFFYKDPDANLLIQADEQPSLGLSLQASAVYHNKSSLFPVDPLHGGLLLKRDQLPDSFDYIDSHGFLVWFLFIVGALGFLSALVRIGMLGMTSWKVSRQMRYPEDYRLDNPLGSMVMHCQYELSEHWINVMHETLAREKRVQQKREKRLMLFTLFTATAGTLMTAASVIKAMSLPVLSADTIIQALIPLTASVAVCIALLTGHALLIVCHRFFLLKLENSSWALLFGCHKKRLLNGSD